MRYSDKIKYRRLNKSSMEPIEAGDIYIPYSSVNYPHEALVVVRRRHTVVCNFKEGYVEKTLNAWNQWGRRHKIKS